MDTSSLPTAVVGRAPDGTFHPLGAWDGEALMQLFRERLLARLVEKHAISQELVAKLMAWKHPGFSAFVGEPIPPENTKAIEDMAGYVVRNPLSLKRLVYVDGQQAVIYRALKPNPRSGKILRRDTRCRGSGWPRSSGRRGQL